MNLNFSQDLTFNWEGIHLFCYFKYVNMSACEHTHISGRCSGAAVVSLGTAVT